ncbi:hypothetical protein ABEF95_003711 [Exophiala dermatitidis]
MHDHPPSSLTTPPPTETNSSTITTTTNSFPTTNPDPNPTIPEWHPAGLLSGHPTRPYAIIILNQPINYHALDAVIDHADLLVCADAGADRLFKYHQQQQNHPNHQQDHQQHQQQQQQQHLSLRPETRDRVRLPDAIVGDLDSLSPQVEHHYRSQGVDVIKDPNQYSTDFTKCLKWIRQAVQQQQQQPRQQPQPQPQSSTIMDVVVLGGLGGRVDQAFSEIHHLYLASNDPELLVGRIYLLSEQSLSFVLAESDSDTTGTSRSNLNIIHVPDSDFDSDSDSKPDSHNYYFEENVGIIPVLGRCLITTTGLEWDVEDWPTEFGGQLSTSNHIRSNLIKIAFQGPRPLFTMELGKRFRHF